MTGESRTEVGHGVKVSRTSPESLQVHSSDLALPWQVRQGHLPGTAVAWGDELYEVEKRQVADGAIQWRLHPWPDGAVARRVFRLDLAALDALAVERDRARTRHRKSRLLHLLFPLMGFAPARLQLEWESELGFRAPRATILSTGLEIVPGLIGSLQLMSLTGAGWWLPPWLHVLAYLGPVLTVDALVRFSYAMGHNLPLGSVLTFPLVVLRPRRTPPPAVPSGVPAVTVHDPDRRVLELASSTLRTDWREGSVLVFRDQRWRLVGLASHGAPWLYRFELDASGLDSPAELLRLAPGRTGPAPPLPDARGSLRFIARTTCETAALALAPWRFQETLGHRVGLTPRVLTTMGGLVECLGGVINLRAGVSDLTVLLDLFFLAEGVLRVAAALALRQGCGSVFGLLLLPLYRQWERAPARGPSTTAV